MIRQLATFSSAPLHKKLALMRIAYLRIKSVYYRSIFGEYGSRSVIERPTLIENPQWIYIGNKVSIRAGARIQTTQTSSTRIPHLRIGDNTNIEQNCHIVCHNRISIGSNVSIAPHCALVDATHPLRQISEDTNIGSLLDDDDGFVEIGNGTCLGFGCIVMPNVRIGKGCFIGANSVVTKDVPDYTVAYGSPISQMRPLSERANAEVIKLS